MKKVRKLSLNKETVRHLTNEELRGVAGGGPTNGNTCPGTCQGNTCPATACGSTCEGTCGAGCQLSIVICETTESSTCSGPSCP